MAEQGEPLSAREHEVLHELAQGASNREIALTLSISPNTVKVHVRNLLAKLGAASRTEAATLAIQQGLIDADQLFAAQIDDNQLDVTPELVDVNALDTSMSSPAPEGAGEPAITGSAVQSSQRPVAFLAGIAILIAILVGGYVVVRFFTQDGEPATEVVPFVAEAIGESGWTTAPGLDRPRARFATASIGLNLYRISGVDERGVTSSSAVFKSDLAVWQPIADKPTAVAGADAAVVADQIYVVGGESGGGRPIAVVEAYSPSVNAWRSAAAMPQPLTGPLAVAGGGFLYVAGGWDGEAYSSELYVYDPAADTWRPLPGMTFPRAYAAGAIINNKIYVVGGYGPQGETAVCERFDPITEQWESCPAMLVPRANASAVALFNKLYVIGGGMDDAIPYAEQYDASQSAWQVLNLPMVSTPQQWINLGVGAVETRIYAFGGEVDGELNGSSYVFNPFPYQFYFPSTILGSEE